VNDHVGSQIDTGFMDGRELLLQDLAAEDVLEHELAFGERREATEVGVGLNHPPPGARYVLTGCPGREAVVADPIGSPSPSQT
jgi:hypothetical protein